MFGEIISYFSIVEAVFHKLECTFLKSSWISSGLKGGGMYFELPAFCLIWSNLPIKISKVVHIPVGSLFSILSVSFS